MGIEYTLLIGGRNPLFREAIDHVCGDFNSIFEDEGWEQNKQRLESHPALYIDPHPKADAGVAALIVGVAVFVAGWASEKILDQFFEKKLRDGVSNLINAILKKCDLNENQSIEFRHIVWYEDLELAVIIQLMVSNEDQLRENEQVLLQAHRNASSWVESHGKKSPVHSYVIESGKCNLEPALYNSLSEIDSIEANVSHEQLLKEFRIKSNKANLADPKKQRG